MTKLLPFLLFSAFLWGQSDSIRYETFKKEIKSTQSHAKKIALYDSIIVYGKKLNYPADFEELVKTSIALSKQEKAYGSLLYKTSELIYFYNTYKITPEEAVPFAKEVFSLESKFDNRVNLGNVYMYYGESLFRMGKNKESLYHIKKSLAIFLEKHDPKSEGFARMYMSWPLSHMGKFAEASMQLQKSLKLFEHIKDKDMVFAARSELATLYSKNGFLKEAKKERAFLFESAKGDLYSEAVLYINQGTDEGKMGNKQKQIEYYTLALEKGSKTEGANFFRPVMQLELAAKLYEQNQSEKAQAYIDDFLKEYSPTNEYYRNFYLNAMAAKYFYEKNWSKANTVLQEQIKMNEQAKDWENLMNAQLKFSKVLAQQNDYKGAFEQYKDYATLKDSILNVQKVNGLSYYQTLYETEKRDKIIDQQQSDLDILEAEHKASERLLYIVLIVAVLGIGIVLLFVKQRQARKEQKLQEQLSQQLLQAQEEERTKIARDLHDGLGQELILLKQTSQKQAQTEMTTQIESVLHNVRSISRQLHPVLLKQLGLKATLEDLFNRLDEQSTVFFTYHIDAIDGLFSFEQELNLFRFFQESLSNVIKHSQATAVEINVLVEGKNVSISVEDNGVGFIVKEKMQQAQHFGLQTMEERIKILHGNFAINSIPNKKTTLNVNIQLT